MVRRLIALILLALLAHAQGIPVIAPPPQAVFRPLGQRNGRGHEKAANLPHSGHIIPFTLY
jgi:hypothetical protein